MSLENHFKVLYKCQKVAVHQKFFLSPYFRIKTMSRQFYFHLKMVIFRRKSTNGGDLITIKFVLKLPILIAQN